MKIEIDLDEIFDEGDSVEDSIRKQVIEHITARLQKGIASRVDKDLGEAISRMIEESLRPRMDGLITDILDAEFTPVDLYGTRGKPTSFRNEMIRVVHENMKYAPKTYHDSQNAFTKAVTETIRETTDRFRAEFNKEVDAGFLREAMAYATQKLRERVGIK